MKTTFMVLASSIDALADQLQRLIANPSQQAPAQTCALADRVATLGQQLRDVDFRSGVRMGQVAERLRGHAVARVFTPLKEEDLTTLTTMLRAAASMARDACHDASPVNRHGGDAA